MIVRPSERFDFKLNVVTAVVAFVVLTFSSGDCFGGRRDIDVFRWLDFDACLR